MIQGTTPIHTFNISFDTSFISKVRVLYSQNGEVKIKKEHTDCTLGDKTITVQLTQDDTFKLDPNSDVEIQVRVLTTGNDSLVSIPKKVAVIKCLENEVFE